MKTIATRFGLDARRRVRVRASAAILLLLAVLLAVNLAVGLLPDRIAHPDVTGSDTFLLSDAARERVAALTDDVTIYLVCEGGERNADPDLRFFLRQYAELSSRVTVKCLDPAADPAFAETYGTDYADQTILVTGRQGVRTFYGTDLYYYYNGAMDMDFSPENFALCLDAYLSGDSSDYELYLYGQYLYQYADSTVACFDGGSQITNAVNYVSADRVPVVCVLTGNDCVDVETMFLYLLAQNVFDIRQISSVDAMPADCALLLINDPLTDFTPADAEKVAAYLDGGGSLALTTGYYAANFLPNLTSLLSAYGVGVGDVPNVICETNSAYCYQGSPYYHLAQTNIAAHPANGNFAGAFVASYPHQITVADPAPDHVTVTPWFTSSASSVRLLRNEELETWVQDEEPASYPFGVLAERGSSRLLWVSSPDTFSANGYSYSEGGNFDLMLSAFRWLCDSQNEWIDIDATIVPTNVLAPSQNACRAWIIAAVVLVPLAILAAGFTVVYRRHK